jgi:hypothetical protein
MQAKLIEAEARVNAAGLRANTDELIDAVTAVESLKIILERLRRRLTDDVQPDAAPARGHEGAC